MYLAVVSGPGAGVTLRIGSGLAHPQWHPDYVMGKSRLGKLNVKTTFLWS